MKKQSLLGESLKVAFSKQAILFVVICSAVSSLANLVPLIGGLAGLVFSILFACYSYNIALQKALQNYLPNVDDPAIISMKPAYGKTPPAMFGWSLLYGLGLLGIIIVGMMLCVGVGSAVDNSIVSILLGLLAFVGSIAYVWLVFCPQVLGKVLDNDALNADFKANLDKKYYLIMLVGGIVVTLVFCLLAFAMFGSTMISLFSAASTTGSASSAAITALATQMTFSLIIIVLVVSLIAGVVNIAGYYYAYASWLRKIDTKEVASVFGITAPSTTPSNTTEPPVKEEVNTVQEVPASTPTMQSVASEPNTEPVTQEVNNTLDELMNTPQTTPQPFSEPVKTPTETPVNNSAFQNQYQETPVDNSIRQVEPPKTIKINLNANK